MGPSSAPPGPGNGWRLQPTARAPGFCTKRRWRTARPGASGWGTYAGGCAAGTRNSSSRSRSRSYPSFRLPAWCNRLFRTVPWRRPCRSSSGGAYSSRPGHHARDTSRDRNSDARSATGTAKTVLWRSRGWVATAVHFYRHRSVWVWAPDVPIPFPEVPANVSPEAMKPANSETILERGFESAYVVGNLVHNYIQQGGRR